ncbi:shikimate kinase [Cytobacillus sp. Hz8]|uniref:shikimate kinase n=1 Tax=Cytobacillus sp. Hz8 TaxID=3347168 RepID=UPI0035D7417D
MQPIYIIGFMGTGKSTVGKALGELFELSVYDTDEEIMKQQKMSINEIFAQMGETGFRMIETETLNRMPKNGIITTGGGIILKEENVKYMKETGVVFLLHATIEEILRRLENDESRPLLKGSKKENAVKLYSQREPLYLKAADFIIDTTSKSIFEIIKEIKNRLKC